MNTNYENNENRIDENKKFTEVLAEKAEKAGEAAGEAVKKYAGT